MLKHNKKRNVGLIREFFTKFIAEAALSNKSSEAEKAKIVWKKYFSKGTELNKEFNAFKSLLETKVSSKDIAFEFLKKVKNYVKNIDVEKLNSEKTSLIREVYSSIGEKEFFEKQVEDYTLYASIQICLDDWKSKNLNESIINPAIVELEDKILNNLLKPKDLDCTKETIKENIEVDKLALKILLEKYNKKFYNTLTESQQKLIKLYVFDSNMEQLNVEIQTIRENTLNVLSKELRENKKLPETQKKKFEAIKSILEESKNSSIDEDTIVFYMSVSKLHDEFKEE